MKIFKNSKKNNRIKYAKPLKKSSTKHKTIKNRCVVPSQEGGWPVDHNNNPGWSQLIQQPRWSRERLYDREHDNNNYDMSVPPPTTPTELHAPLVQTDEMIRNANIILQLLMKDILLLNRKIQYKE